MNNTNNKKTNKRYSSSMLIAIIALILGVLILFGAAIGIGLSDKDDSSSESNHSKVSGDDDGDWTNNY